MILRSSTVLVTGAAGFVGPYVCGVLRMHGARVAGVGLESAAPAGLPVDAWRTADLFDAAAMRDAVAGARPDAIVHLAGQSSAARSFQAPEETFRANVLGTWHVLEAVRAAASGARVLVIGSGEAYGPQPEGSRTAEDAPFAPVSPYALSKAAAESMSFAHARAHGLDVVCVRAFSHTGPGQDARFAIPGWARQIAAIERGEAPPTLAVGNLDVVRDIGDVRDVARAYAALLERGRAGVAYNVCRGDGVRLAEVARALAERANVPVAIVPDPARMRPADVPWLVGDRARLTADTGWWPEFALARTLDDVLADWRARAPANG